MLIRGNEPNSDEQESAKSICASSINTTKSFYNIIQGEDKEAFVKRLHTLIDGKKGKDIAVVFIQARIVGLITRYPTKGELNSEFDWKGSWQSIYKVLQRDWDNGNLNAASAIRFD
jgi:hypothetical protein